MLCCVQLWIRSAEPPGEHRYENGDKQQPVSLNHSFTLDLFCSLFTPTSDMEHNFQENHFSRGSFAALVTLRHVCGHRVETNSPLLGKF